MILPQDTSIPPIDVSESEDKKFHVVVCTYLVAVHGKNGLPVTTTAVLKPPESQKLLDLGMESFLVNVSEPLEHAAACFTHLS